MTEKRSGRTSQGARVAALRGGDIATLYAGRHPALLGWSKDGTEIWEVLVHFEHVETGPEEYLWPFDAPTLLSWAATGELELSDLAEPEIEVPAPGLRRTQPEGVKRIIASTYARRPGEPERGSYPPDTAEDDDLIAP